MRRFLFPFLKIFARVFKKSEDFFSSKGLGRISGAKTLHRLTHLPYDWVYYKLKPKGIVLINVQGNKMYVDTDDRDISFRLLRNGFWEEKYETELFNKMVKEGMVVVDIGANIGYYTLIAAKLAGKRGIVYAFEPMPSNYKLLYKNIEANGYTNVVPIQKAVSNKHGKVILWFERDWSGSPSFLKEATLAVSGHKTLEKGGFMEVETINLDEFFKNTVKNTKVDIIKVDTGGGEGLIVDGAEEVLRSNNVKIFLEFWPDALRDLGTDPSELLSKLREYGFRIQFINERKQALEPLDNEKAKAGTGFNLFLEK